MRRENHVRLRLSRPQYEILMFRAPPHPETGAPQVEQVGILGEFGGGKTYIAGHRFKQVANENPSADRYDPLMSGVSAPTMKGLISGPITALRRAGLEVRTDKLRDSTDPHFWLPNWHKVIPYTGRGALDGPNLVQFWGDEIQDKSYENEWANMAGRVRDTRGRRLNAQASGIAVHGYVESIFRNPPRDGCHLTKLLFPESNMENLPPGYADMVRAAAVGGRQRDPDGWMIPDGLFYPAFSDERNIQPVAHLDRIELTGNPTDIAIDLGARAAVTWWQPITMEVAYGQTVRREMCQLCVDQWMPDDLDAEEIAKVCRSADWHLDPNVSTISLDPTAEADQRRAFEIQFPGVRIVMAPKHSFYWWEENGVRATARAILDANGATRLFVHPDLVGDESARGVVESLRAYRRDKPKDKVLEHAADSVRYQIQHRLPLPNVRRQITRLQLGSPELEGVQWWRH